MCDREHCPLGDKYEFAAEDKAFVDKIRKRLVIKLTRTTTFIGTTNLDVILLYKDDLGEEYEISSDCVMLD